MSRGSSVGLEEQLLRAVRALLEPPDELIVDQGDGSEARIKPTNR